MKKLMVSDWPVGMDWQWQKNLIGLPSEIKYKYKSVHRQMSLLSEPENETFARWSSTNKRFFSSDRYLRNFN